MTSALTVASFAKLRSLLRTMTPDWLEANDAAWRGWQQAVATAPANRAHPQVIGMAAISCIEDILLHVGLLQLLRQHDEQVFPIFIVPSASVLDVVRHAALRDGWASLVGFEIETEVPQMIGRLPDEATVIHFSYPIPLNSISLVRDSGEPAVALDAGVTVATASTLLQQVKTDRTTADRHELVTLARILEAADPQQPALDTLEPFKAAVAIQDYAAPALEAWIRPGSVALPGAMPTDWVTATLRDGARPAQVIARQPACFADITGDLIVPLAPSLASETMKTLQIHRQSSNGLTAGPEMPFNILPRNIAPWMVSAYLNKGGAGNPVIEAFAQGLGCRLAYAEDEGRVLKDIPVVWGVLRDSDRIIAQAREQGLYFYYIDHAYFDRGHGHSYRITRNAYEAGRVRKVSDSRLKMLNLDIQPWRKSGRSIVVCPPTEYFAAAHGCSDWLETTLHAIRLETDRPIIVRTKPQAGQPFSPLAHALKDAHALVTHSSNVAIEAVCLGTPVFVSPASAAAPVGHTDIGLINTPRYPKREGWLSHLAYSQYTLDEIRDGSAWKLLMYLEDRAIV